jgi:hypothetical protein
MPHQQIPPPSQPPQRPARPWEPGPTQREGLYQAPDGYWYKPEPGRLVNAGLVPVEGQSMPPASPTYIPPEGRDLTGRPTPESMAKYRAFQPPKPKGNGMRRAPAAAAPPETPSVAQLGPMAKPSYWSEHQRRNLYGPEADNIGLYDNVPDLPGTGSTMTVPTEDVGPRNEVAAFSKSFEKSAQPIPPPATTQTAQQPDQMTQYMDMYDQQLRALLAQQAPEMPRDNWAHALSGGFLRGAAGFNQHAATALDAFNGADDRQAKMVSENTKNRMDLEGRKLDAVSRAMEAAGQFSRMRTDQKKYIEVPGPDGRPMLVESGDYMRLPGVQESMGWNASPEYKRRSDEQYQVGLEGAKAKAEADRARAGSEMPWPVASQHRSIEQSIANDRNNRPQSMGPVSNVITEHMRAVKAAYELGDIPETDYLAEIERLSQLLMGGGMAAAQPGAAQGAPAASSGVPHANEIAAMRARVEESMRKLHGAGP